MCHPIDQVNQVKYDQAGWRPSLPAWSRTGSSSTPEERQAILDYLVQRDAGN